MPTRRSSKGSSAEPTAIYAEWKARCVALLERQGILARGTVAATVHTRRNARAGR
jgi:hypothetical protein